MINPGCVLWTGDIRSRYSAHHRSSLHLDFVIRQSIVCAALPALTSLLSQTFYSVLPAHMGQLCPPRNIPDRQLFFVYDQACPIRELGSSQNASFAPILALALLASKALGATVGDLTSQSSGCSRGELTQKLIIQSCAHSCPCPSPTNLAHQICGYMLLRAGFRTSQPEIDLDRSH